MAKNKDNSGVDWDSLTPEQREAYIPRGEYKNPELLDQGNAPAGAPTTPQPELEEGGKLGEAGTETHKKTEAKTSKTDK
jgi:hypothetical protein